MHVRSALAESIGCIDAATGELVEPRGVYVTYRCNEGHATRVRDDVDADCDLCFHLNPSAPPDEYPCKHCSQDLEQHAGTSCLFMPTKFEPMDQYQLQQESDVFWEGSAL